MNPEKEETMREYMNGVWGLSYSNDNDIITMFYACGYYSLAAKLLVEAGAVVDDSPEGARLMLKAAKETDDSDFDDAYTQCLGEDYRVYYCQKCDRPHYINCLYFNEAQKSWPCDDCAYMGPMKVEACCTDPLCSCNNYSVEDTVRSVK